ncbi:MAG: MFS transporter [Haloarculaceae archaeon]
MSSKGFSSEGALVVALVGGSHFVNHAYFMLLPPVFGPLQAELDVGLPAVGLAASLVGAVVVALQLPFGYLSDTRGRTPVLAVTLALGALGAALVATAETYPWLLAGAAVMGVGLAGHHSAHYPLLSAATRPSTRGRAFSVHGFTGALGFAAPPAVVGAATALGFDWRVAVGSIAAVGGLYAVACLAVFRRSVSRDVTHGLAAGTGGDEADASVDADAASSLPALRRLPARIVSELRSLASSTAIVLLTVLWFLTSLANWGIQTYTNALLETGYSVPEGTANLLVSGMLVVGAVAILGGGWLSDRYSARAVVLGGFGALIAMTLALASGVLPRVLVFALTLVFIASVKVGRPALSKLGDSLSADEDLGKNFGLLTIGISGGGAVAPYVYGVVISATNVRFAFATIAAVGVAAIAMTFVVVGVSERSAAAGGSEPEAATAED